GSWTSSQFRWSPIEAWLPGGVPSMAADAARTELVRRWLAAFGPATTTDVKWWTGWTVAQTKAALASVRAVEVELEAGAGWLLPGDDGPARAPAPWVSLLPALDPTAMGWREAGRCLKGMTPNADKDSRAPRGHAWFESKAPNRRSGRRCSTRSSPTSAEEEAMRSDRKLAPPVGAPERSRRKVTRIASLAVVAGVAVLFLPAASVAAPAVGLGTADSFAVLAGSGITNTGPTTITCDIGTFPNPAETGFVSVTVNGTNHVADAVTQQAKDDLVTA